ncbi:HNH endonuclease signature motif containing protein [Nitrosopumilus sp.]|uniref:HNH endonuclease signature motif containing protein n=1 Tax=Nitrosopumilus sp. TaxID=2024843 RepID=UPI0034A0A274
MDNADSASVSCPNPRVIMNIQLSDKLKRDYLPDIVFNDGFVCLYCEISLVGIKYVYEHLDDDPTNNIRENIALSCQSCNNKKPSSTTMKQIALTKKAENEKRNYTRGRAREVASPSLKPELDINQTNFDIASQYLSEVVATDGCIEFKTALDSITMRCKTQTGTGSQTAVRRYLDALVSSEGKFMVVQNSEKRRVIVLREGN